MNSIERLCIASRHSRHLEGMSWLWNLARPLYNKTIETFGKSGLERVINGTDRLLVSPKVRGVTEEYEPEVWRSLMAEIKPGDTVADVGAFIGIYTVTLAKRVGKSGRVIAFEPDDAN